MKTGLILAGGSLNLEFAGRFLEGKDFYKIIAVDGGLAALKAVSYTHLDVYKRHVEKLSAYLRQARGTQIVSLLREGIQKANHMLYSESMNRTELRGRGTTLVAAVIDGDTMYVANVGDSRLYLVRDCLKQVTRDHSFVEEMVSLGKLERGSRDYRDQKNIITRAVGMEDRLEIDFFEVGLEPGD